MIEPGTDAGYDQLVEISGDHRAKCQHKGYGSAGRDEANQPQPVVKATDLQEELSASFGETLSRITRHESCPIRFATE